MSVAKKIAIKDFEHRLIKCELSPSKAARLTGLSRRTVDKMVSGHEVRAMTVSKFIRELRPYLQQKDYLEVFEDVESEHSLLDNVFELGSNKGLPKPNPTAQDIINDATDSIVEADNHLMDVIASLSDDPRKSDFQKIALTNLSYRLADLVRHVNELEERCSSK